MFDYKVHDKKFLLFTCYITLFFAIIYLSIEYVVFKKTHDIIFVSILTGATIFLIFKLYDLFEHFKNLDLYEIFDICDLKTKHLNTIFNYRKSFLTGISYGTIFFFLFYYYSNLCDYYSNHVILKFSLCIFVAICNFTTGVAIYFLFNFIMHSLVSLKNEVIKHQSEIFENKSTSIFRTTIKKIANIMVYYISFSLISMIFANVHIPSFLILIYTVFSIILLLIVYICPELQIRNKIKLIRKSYNLMLNTRVNECYKNIETSENINSELEIINNVNFIRESLNNKIIINFIYKVSQIFWLIIIAILPVIIDKVI